MFTKILCATDGSEHANKALKYAAELAKLAQAELTLLYVEPIPLLNLLAFYPPTMMKEDVLPQEVIERLEKHGQVVLDEAAGVLAEAGVKFKTQKVPGHPAQTIMEKAKEGGYDLLVIGSRGWGEMKGILLGSISHHLVHTCPCPVLVVK
jgi:nucleotide-binding universal stress UspA family protein